jgi:FixJ family two-component response regulator
MDRMVSRQPVVFVVDDEPDICTYLATLLKADDYRVVTLASAEELLAQQSPSGPGCLILDVFLPGLSGLDAQDMIKARFSHLPIVFISGQGSIPMSVQAMKAGAEDFLTKPFGRDELGPAVARAIESSKTLYVEQTEQREIQERFARLTQRELDVLRLVAVGKLNKQIAAELDIVEKTVKVHRGRALQKLGVRSVADLVRLADKLDLVTTSPSD